MRTLCVVQVAHAATHKCKDASVEWTEAVCTGTAARRPVEVNPYLWKPVIDMTKEEMEAAVRVTLPPRRQPWRT